jgi:hypothetical protein
MEDLFDSEGNLTEESVGAEPTVTEGDETPTEESAGAEPAGEEGQQEEGDETLTEEAADAVSAIKKGQKPNSFQKRINQKTAENRQLAERIAYLEGQRDYAKTLEKKKAETPPPPKPVFPKISNYEKEADYYEAVAEFQDANEVYTNYIINNAVKEAVGAQGITTQQRDADAAMKDKLEKLTKAGKKAHNDFMESVGAVYTQFTPTISEFAIDSPVGDEIMYQLANNELALRRIESLPEKRAIAELVRIEDYLTQKKPTANFTPITRIKGGGDVQKQKLSDVEDMRRMEKKRYG